MAKEHAPVRSVWEDAERPVFPVLDGDITTDVLVIGGGMAGLLCALLLDRAGVRYVLVEADRICGGATAGTTAKITLQHGFFADRLIRRFGYERAKMYVDANAAALAEYCALCAGMDCGFTAADNIVFTRRDRKLVETEAEALDKLGVRAAVIDSLPVPVGCTGAVLVRNQAQFHPLRFAFAVARELNIYEHTRVVSVSPGLAETERGRIRAERIVIATHFPMLNGRGMYFMKLYQHRSYMLALENVPPVPAMIVDESPSGLTFRQCGDRLLLGGSGSRTGKRSSGWDGLRQFAERFAPDARETAHWAAQDCMTLDGVPYVGQYSRSTSWLYVTTGFGKWGMTGAMAGAMLLRDQLQGKTNDFAPVFLPSRSMLRPQLAVNLAESVAGILRPTAPRCPHMGCALKYNRQERSWDCTCHGSRFAADGTLLDNPAKTRLKTGKR